MNRRIARSIFVAAALLPLAGAASAQQAIANAGAQSAGVAPTASVVAFYDTWRSNPIWFRGGVPSSAAQQLAAILRRAPFDGFAAGPQLALQVEAAVARASSRAPADIAAAEQTLSSAWVQYVQTLKQPVSGMIYGYDVLKPHGSRADQILLTAAAAPSLEAHLTSVSNVNPIYAQLREAAWQQAQAAGNLTPDPRLIANLQRARALPSGGRYLVVDSATQMLTMYENGRPVDSMKVIVGMPELPTPMIASMIHYVTFNPYWNVPHHLVRKTIAPNVLKQGVGYLKSHGYEIMADWTETSGTVGADTIDWKAVKEGKTQIRVRQKPGGANSMGEMKFRFPSGQDIYLHDTPNKVLFAKSNRALSNGCVRLEDARRLGRFLLGREPVAPSAEPELRVQIPQGVPIFLTYLTAQPSTAGVSYLTDVYGWDRATQQVASRN